MNGGKLNNFEEWNFLILLLISFRQFYAKMVHKKQKSYNEAIAFARTASTGGFSLPLASSFNATRF